MARRVEWSILRGTLVVFVLSIAASASMVTASFYFRQNMEREYQAHHAEFREASRKYLAVDDEERIIDQFFPEFRRLYEAGLLGRERRLSWLEALRRAGDLAIFLHERPDLWEGPGEDHAWTEGWIS